MNNQEAIEVLKSNYPPDNYTMLREALDVSIKLLEAEKDGRVVVLPKEAHQPMFVKSDAIGTFNKWNDITGAIPDGTSWYYEAQAVIEEIAAMAFGAGIFYQADKEQAEAALAGMEVGE